jgi:hypothetical protein
MHDELRRVHRLLCSPFVDELLFREALGGSRGDISAFTRYLAMPVARRPALSIYFDRIFYLADNPDVFERQEDPLLHFLEMGCSRLRAPHPLVDLTFIATNDPDVFAHGADIAALVDLLEYDLARPSPYFDLAWYARDP